MQDLKLESMTINSIMVNFSGKENDAHKTSLKKMFDYDEKGINKEFCAIKLKTKSIDDPKNVRCDIIVQVPRSEDEPEYHTSISNYEIKKLKKHEPAGWFLFEKTDKYETEGDEWSRYRYWVGYEDLYELIADMDDYVYGGVIDLECVRDLIEQYNSHENKAIQALSHP